MGITAVENIFPRRFSNNRRGKCRILILADGFKEQPMIQKRFVVAAMELNGVLYVVGGYDGQNYLESAEQFE